MSSKRRQADIRKLVAAGHPVVSVADGDFYVKLRGPAESLYESGSYKVHVILPTNYPYKSPSIGFATPIFHPNIDESSGSVCLDVINQTWSPMYDLVAIFTVFLPQLLSYPNAADPLNRQAAQLYNSDSDAYAKRVKEHVKTHASHDFDLNEEVEKEQKEHEQAKQFVLESLHHSFDQSIHQSLNPTNNQSINQSVNQSNNQSNNDVFEEYRDDSSSETSSPASWSPVSSNQSSPTLEASTLEFDSPVARQLFLDQSLDPSNNQSNNQPFNQSFNQSNNQSNDQSNNQSMDIFSHFSLVGQPPNPDWMMLDDLDLSDEFDCDEAELSDCDDFLSHDAKMALINPFESLMETECVVD